MARVGRVHQTRRSGQKYGSSASQATTISRRLTYHQLKYANLVPFTGLPRSPPRPLLDLVFAARKRSHCTVIKCWSGSQKSNMPLSVHAPHVHGHHRRMSLNSRCLLLFFSISLSIARHSMLCGGFKKNQRTDSFFTSRKFWRRIATWGCCWWRWDRWIQRLVLKLICWC